MTGRFSQSIVGASSVAAVTMHFDRLRADDSVDKHVILKRFAHVRACKLARVFGLVRKIGCDLIVVVAHYMPLDFRSYYAHVVPLDQKGKLLARLRLELVRVFGLNKSAFRHEIGGFYIFERVEKVRKR